MKFENKGEEVLSRIVSHAKKLPRFRYNILLLVTHIDQARNPASFISDIKEMIKEIMPKFKNQIIFYSNLSVGKK
jgi:hypothetical protein